MAKRLKSNKKLFILAIGSAAVCAGLLVNCSHWNVLIDGSKTENADLNIESANEEAPKPIAYPIKKSDLVKALTQVSKKVYPKEMSLMVDGDLQNVKIQYTVEEGLQARMEELFKSYKPHYGAFVALDATTGKVLSLVSYTRDKKMDDNLALRATFPSASIFKVVTAAAAIEAHKLSKDSLIQFSGRRHTLYRNQIFKNNKRPKWMSLKDAFAGSVNSVFGRIGVFDLGQKYLWNYAQRFGFNRELDADVPVQMGQALISDDDWEVAEAASGYTRKNTMSPLQGALIAATIANDGKMMEPYLVNQVLSEKGEVLYSPEVRISSVSIDPNTAKEMRALMFETVSSGTSRRSFRGFFNGEFSKIKVGGKTGSLNGDDPSGRYDWFVGYADGKSRKIAFAALTINPGNWKVKSAFLVRRAIEYVYHDRVLLNGVAVHKSDKSKNSAL